MFSTALKTGYAGAWRIALTIYIAMVVWAVGIDGGVDVISFTAVLFGPAWAIMGFFGGWLVVSILVILEMGLKLVGRQRLFFYCVVGPVCAFIVGSIYISKKDEDLLYTIPILSLIPSMSVGRKRMKHDAHVEANDDTDVVSRM